VIMTLIHYISASRRLNECEKTVMMLGGSQYHDDGIPSQMAAQREMIKREVEYYGERLQFWMYLSPVILLILIMVVMFSIHFGVFK
jgi:hypothetical protein